MTYFVTYVCIFVLFFLAIMLKHSSMATWGAAYKPGIFTVRYAGTDLRTSSVFALLATSHMPAHWDEEGTDLSVGNRPATTGSGAGCDGFWM